MVDPNAGKYQRLYQDEFDMAKRVLTDSGVVGVMEWSNHDWQAFTFQADGLCLVFYPHKTTAGHHHIRVRDQGSKNHKQSHRLRKLLHRESGPNCTFSGKYGGHHR